MAKNALNTPDEKMSAGNVQKKISTQKKSQSATSSKKGKATNTNRKKTDKKAEVQKSKKALSVKKPKQNIVKNKLKNNKELQHKDYQERDADSISRGDMPMTVVDHLDEFRSRLLISLAVIIILTIGSFFVSDYLLTFLMKPFLETGQKLNIFKLTGGFIIRLKVSLATALILGIPVFIFQIWKFILPAISIKDRLFSRLSLLAAVALFYSGVAFVFFLLLPFAIPMLLSFIGTDMISTIGADDYLSFIIMFSIAMGVLYELPIIVMILTKIGILTPQFLIKKRKYSIVIIWIVAALVTPQDVLSQVMVAIPLMFLYEISIVISKAIFLRKHKKEIINKFSQ